MIQVIKHGKQFGWYNCTCKRCGCEFVFSYKDIEKKIMPSGYIGKVVCCPECGEETGDWI